MEMSADLSFHHIGWVVRDLGVAEQELRRFGFDSASEAYRDDRQGVHIVFMTGPGRPRTELIQPSRRDSVVTGLLGRQGPGPYHAAYISSDLHRDVEVLSKAGYRLLAPPAASPAFEGRLFCFLYGQTLGLIELVQGADGAR